MVVTEAARHGLYTALVTSIGEEHAETLMAALPAYEPTDADLQLHLAPIVTAIGHLKGDNGGFRTDLTSLKADVAVLKSDVAVLKADVVVLKSDVGTLKTDVSTFKADVATLKASVDKGFDQFERSFHKLWWGMLGSLVTVVGALFAAVGLG